MNYKIWNRFSGANLGVYSGRTKAEAVGAMRRDAGDPDWGDDDELIVEETDEPTLAQLEEW